MRIYENILFYNFQYSNTLTYEQSIFVNFWFSIYKWRVKSKQQG